MPMCWGSQIFCLELVSHIQVCHQLKRRDLSLLQSASLQSPIDSLQCFLDKKLRSIINPSLSFTSHSTSASSTFRMWPSSPPPPPPILNQISPYISSFQSLKHKPPAKDQTTHLNSPPARGLCLTEQSHTCSFSPSISPIPIISN